MAAMGQVREAKYGELCCCGKQAKSVLVTRMGEVPTCKDAETYSQEIARNYQLSTGGLLRSSGQSGAR